ncbi:hypothetical protein BRC81_10520 [Halobacteriales archaeon QS_1_68_20]|nr:MAG: hypothetical protein BRC81_10520 [Halobacteriales archaeon QS_1_68_20]
METSTPDVVCPVSFVIEASHLPPFRIRLARMIGLHVVLQLEDELYGNTLFRPDMLLNPQMRPFMPDRS